MSEDDFFGIRVDGAIWVALRDFISTSHALLPAVSWRPRLDFPTQPQASAEATRRIKALVLGEVSPATEEAARALLHTAQHHEWPELSDRAAYDLTVALEQIVRFLDLCAVPAVGGGSEVLSVFQARTNNLSELAVWFYVEWWHSVGIRRWLDDVLRDEATFYSYFQRRTQ